jgi:hypothetical protein
MSLPVLPKACDLTIAQSRSNKDFSQSALEQICNKNDRDYPHALEALFVVDNLDLTNDNFQILLQEELANCVIRNHMYLCDKHNVVEIDFTDTSLRSLCIEMEQGA